MAITAGRSLVLINTNESEVPQGQSYDVCIIGAGAAGITLARKLAEAGKRVALCEGGLLEFTGDSQDSYIGEVIGDPYFDLDVCRLRYFGGSTNHWGGMTRLLDEIDFERGYLGAEFEWPIKRGDIDPFLSEACKIIDIDSIFEDETVGGEVGVKRLDVKLSPPTRFADKYLAEITESERIHLYLGANFLDLIGEANVATSAVFSDYAGRRFEISSAAFVFAMGGIENSRMLLWLNELHRGRYFNANLPIGSYWMEHPNNRVGQALIATSSEEEQYYGLSGEKQRELGILGCKFTLDRQGGNETERLANDLLCVAPRLGARVLSLIDKGLVCGVRVRCVSEQAPDRENRVALAQGRDRFDIPTVALHWKKRELDRRTIERSYPVLNNWLLADNLGRLKVDDWLLEGGSFPDDDYGGHHHMGGTRMGSRTDISVVDRDCRVHGSVNIYVAGSSVFATGGHANPTLPLLQFTLRLAQHLTT
jgi:hypothetical protein